MMKNRDNAPYYYVPGPSSFPLSGSVAMLFFGIGATAWVNSLSWGPYVFGLGILLFILNLKQWFSTSIQESEQGLYGSRIDISYRWSMSWFIFSEIMFFAAFFGALFYARVYSTEWRASIDSKILWPSFNGTWPNRGPSELVESYSTMGAAGIPLINTCLLLTSGLTLTWAHHAIQKNHRAQAIQGLVLTVLLSIIFLGFQTYEYMHAYSDLNLKLSSGIYGSLFYLLTGFHGFHVLIGTIMLSVVLFRLMRGHMNDKHHFAFEGAAWYWHFVDIVWLFLFVVVYCL
jgi:cytochrome c oxidase subunit 3